MTKNEITTRAALAARILSLKSVQSIMAKNPDADWNVEYKYEYAPDCWLPTEDVLDAVLVGTVAITTDDDLDIRDLANDATVDSWVYKTRIKKRSTAGSCVEIAIVVFQPYTEDEVDLLKAVGVLQENTYTPRSYNTLACSI